MINGRLMNDGRWGTGGLARRGAAGAGDRGRAEGPGTWQTVVLGVGGGHLDAATREGDGEMDLHERGRAGNAARGAGWREMGEKKGVCTYSPWLRGPHCRLGQRVGV
jgi:hypothetical protein